MAGLDVLEVLALVVVDALELLLPLPVLSATPLLDALIDPVPLAVPLMEIADEAEEMRELRWVDCC